MAGLLVTGTDTGVGKTVVACALAGALVERGVRVAVWKPAETDWTETATASSDAARLRRAVGSSEPIDVICPYRFRAPLAPAWAAQLEGRRIDMKRLAVLYDDRARSFDCVIVEGAGGLLVPIDAGATYAELARDLDLAVLIVAANRLGAINHTALTARAAAAAGVRVLGFVLNHPWPGGPASPEAVARDAVGTGGSDTDAAAAATNREAIVTLTHLPCLGEIPFISSPEARPDRARASLDVTSIRRLLASCGNMVI